MKKWLISLCCLIVALAIVSVVILRNKNTQIDTLNQDLTSLQTEINTLREADTRAMEDLNRQVEDLNQQVESLNQQVQTLTAENSSLHNTLEKTNTNLSSSQEKLQNLTYILTDGAEGSLDNILSSYIRVFEDVPLNSPYFDAVSYVCKHGLMLPQGDDTFGLAEKVTLGEFAECLNRLSGKAGTREETIAALLQSEQLWITDVQQQVPEEGPLEVTEQPEAEEPAAKSEVPAEEAEEPAIESEAPTEEAEQPEAGSDTEPEAPAEEESKPADDENTILTRERILSFCRIYCQENTKDVPAITFPESESEEAVRGDLAIVLAALGE